MHLFKILPILASACCVAASDEGSTRKEPLRGFLEDKHLIAPEDHHSVSITSDSPKNLQKYCVETEIWWVDSNGDNCDWYDDDRSRCDKAHKWINNDLDATDVCCACKGGEEPSGCTDSESWTDINGFGCKWYNNRNPRRFCGTWAEDNANRRGKSANDKCCICKRPYPPTPSPTPSKGKGEGKRRVRGQRDPGGSRY